MRPLISLLCFMAPTVVFAQQCPVTEGTLQGAWKSRSEAAFFDQMSFERQGATKTFNSWLHQRPEISGGTWKLANCVISIAHPTDKNLSFEFAVLKASKDRLQLREVGETETLVFQRIP